MQQSLYPRQNANVSLIGAFLMNPVELVDLEVWWVGNFLCGWIPFLMPARGISNWYFVLKKVQWLIGFLSCDFLIISYMPSVLWRCWLGGRKGIRPVKNFDWCSTGMVICLERDADLHMAQLMPLPLTVSCFSKIQIGFTFLVPAHPGSPGKRAVKRVCVCAYRNALRAPGNVLAVD